MSGELLLIGSIPYDTVEKVFQSFGAELGPYLLAMPDGEVGPRKHWPDFSLGAYCGFGRVPPAELPKILEEHLEAAQALRRR